MNWMNAKTTRGFGLALGLAAGAFAFPVAASADEALDFTYDVMVSGLQAAKIKFDMDLTPTGYRSKASVETQGIVSFFSDSQTFVGTSGEIVNGKAVPASFSTRTEKSGKQKDFKVRWTESGQPEPHQPPVKNPQMQAEILDALALAAGVIDPITAVLSVRGDAPCEGTQRIYSGRDVFDLSFTLEREVTFNDKSDGVYRGSAYQCRMLYTPIAGRDATKARKKKIEPWAVTVWFAPVDSQSLGGQVLLPVAAAGKLDGRKFRAFASRASVSGQALNQLSSISTN